MKKKLILGICALSMGFVACKKDENETPQPAPSASTPANITPTPSDADGVLIAIDVASIINIPGFGDQTTSTGTAVAVFPDGAGNFNAAGDITVEGEALSKQDNNSYVFIPSQTNPTVLTFDNTINWDVAGEGNVTGFERPISNTIPGIGDLTAEGEVSTSAAFELAVDLTNDFTDLAGADSLYFGVYGPNGQLLVSQAYSGAASAAYTFTADEMATVGAGSGFIQVAAVDFSSNIISNQKIYFLNEGTMTKSVTFN